MAMTRGRERCFTLLTVRSRQPKQPRELGGGPSRRDMLPSQTGNMRKWGKAVVAMLVAVGAAFTACGGAIVSSDPIEMTSLDASSSATPSLDASSSATPSLDASSSATPIDSSGAISDACKATEQTCAQSTECCTGSCALGQCAERACVRDEEPCAQSNECCSGGCTRFDAGVGRCARPRGCYLRGEACVLSSQCCGAVCVDVDGSGRVCAGGCQAGGERCLLDYDCCSGQCTKVVGGSGVCAAGCVQDLYVCRHNADCCSGVCTSVDGGYGACVPR